MNPSENVRRPEDHEMENEPGPPSPDEFCPVCWKHERDCDCDPEDCRQETEQEHMERMIAFAQYQEEKMRRELEEEQQECPHDEHDHGICLSCSKDIMDDLIDRAEMLRDE